MTDREKLIELNAHFVENFDCGSCVPDEHKCKKCLTEKEADHLIDNGVTIPVRCKDCKHCGVLEHNGKRYCKKPMGCLGCTPTESDNFCSYGERRTNHA